MQDREKKELAVPVELAVTEENRRRKKNMADYLWRDVWPEWEIMEHPIGRGSYGVVYEAVRREYAMENRSAIKVISIPQNQAEIDNIRSEGMSEELTVSYFRNIVNNFIKEIQLMESFKGMQNIVSVEDYKVVEKKGEIGWDIYIRMELLTPLSRWLGSRFMTEKEAIKLGIDICTALERCAQKNVIHRDVKIENIFLNSFGDYKLGDFGIARTLENLSSGLSQKGTYNYMAPEIATGCHYDATVDIYSLGIVLYKLLNKNRLPFLETEQQMIDYKKRMEAVRRRMNGEQLPAPCDASPAMTALIRKACAYNPQDRFASAAEMKQALRRVENGSFQGRVSSERKEDIYRNTGDDTVLLRRAEAQNPRQSPPVQRPGFQEDGGSFGRKKSGIAFRALLLAAGVVVMLLLSVCVIFLPKRKVAEDSGKKAETEKTETIYSSYDEEQIDSIIGEAEKFADAGDYEGALTKIKTGLVTYPKSERLKEKEEEYTDLHAQHMAALEESGGNTPSGSGSPGTETGPEAAASDNLETAAADSTESAPADEETGENSSDLLPVSNSVITNVAASSFLEDSYPDTGYMQYPPGNIIDGDSSTAWVEGSSGDGVGEWIQIEFGGMYVMSGINICNGYQKSEDIYLKNNRVKNIRLHFSDNSYIDYELSDSYGQTQSLMFPQPMRTDRVVLEILSVYSGVKYQDTCLSEIQVF